MSLVCGRTRSTGATNAGAAAVARAAGFESAMTRQWYTNDATETPRPMKIRALGHVSLFVRDLAATRHFYRDLLGLAETGTGKDGRIVFFSAGARHHDLSCELARAAGPGPQPKGVPGLYHVAFEVGETAAELAGARRDVVTQGLAPYGEYANGFCVRDPDGHEVELYVEPPRVSARRSGARGRSDRRRPTAGPRRSARR
jgi:catechol 2,3-dioxygenase